MKKQLLRKLSKNATASCIIPDARYYILRFIALAMLFFCFTLARAQQRTIYGKVSDKDNRFPLQGVTITGKGSNANAQTDSSGKFLLQLPESVTTLSFSYIGYVQKEISISKTQTEVVIDLSADTKELSDVVVSSGYGTQRKRDFTGSAAQVSGEILENRPAQNFTQLMGGQAAGVDIVQPSSALNNPPVMRIRGINSISSGIFPLVVVDGVTLFTGSAGGSVGNDPLADINPSDIETIDVLKDASATAIYGSRAANGVLVITTKKGKKGKAKVNYDGWVGLSKPYNLPELLDAYEYVTIKNEARVNAGLTPGFALQTLTDGTVVNTDWYKEAYHTGVSQSHNINLSGANDATNYYFSIGYTDQNGFIKKNTFGRNVARLNIDHKLFNGVTIGATISYSNSINKGPNTGAIAPNSIAGASGNTSNSQYIGLQPLGRLTYILPPNVAAFNEDGSYNINPANGTIGYGANSPSLGVFNAWNLRAVQELDKNKSENNTFIGSIYTEIAILKNLKFKTNFGIDNLVIENSEFRNPYSGDGATARPNIIGGGSATQTQTHLTTTNWTNTLTYSTVIGWKHNLRVLAGFEQIHRTVEGWGAIRSGITDPFYTSYQGGWSTIAPTGSIQSENGLQSFFSNINYDYNKKYLLSLNFRRDGLSALAKGNKWGNFGGGSIGWNISEESFFKSSDLYNVVSNLKLRGSYGIVGNSSIADFASLSTYSSFTYGGIATLYFSQAGNPNLKWETSKKTDIGIDVGLFRNKINITADYFNNLVDGLILNSPVSSSQGIPGNAIAANVGAMYNRGIEFSINAKMIEGSLFRWTTSFNFSTLKNKVTSLGNVGEIYPTNLATFGIQNMTRVGYSVGSIYAVPTTGVNPDNGNRVYINRDGDEVQYDAVTKAWSYMDGSVAPAIDNYADGRILGPSLPTYFGGFNNSFSYGNLDLNIGLTFSGGNKLYNGTWSTISDMRYFNSGKFVLNRWTKPGDITDVPKLVWGNSLTNGFSSSNSAYVEDGSFIKLKNISLGYKIPVDKIGVSNYISSIRVYAQAANLFTLTKYRGSDPEVSINGNSINSGKDQNVPPNAWNMTFGINVGF